MEEAVSNIQKEVVMKECGLMPNVMVTNSNDYNYRNNNELLKLFSLNDLSKSKLNILI